MKFLRNKKIILIVAILIIAITSFTLSTSHQEIDFNTQVKPIINKKCITCHGGVRQQANFSLLFRDWALKKNKSGKYAIIPGDVEHSELIRRITSNDPEDRMPYHHDPLSKEEI
ncbi:MAG: c-type cytochrome domain-containing protein, partial [Parafilimonas sp.]